MKFISQRSIYLLILGAILFYACSKDEDTGEVYSVIYGSFQVDGKTFATNYATLANDDLSRTYDTIIFIDTVINGKDTTVKKNKTITEREDCDRLTLSNIRPDSAAREVYSISFSLLFPSPDRIGIFTYDYLSFDNRTYNNSRNFSNPKCIHTDNDGAVKYSDCTSGTLSVEQTADSLYIFKYNLVFTGNKTVSGNYKGTLQDRTGRTDLPEE